MFPHIGLINPRSLALLGIAVGVLWTPVPTHAQTESVDPDEIMKEMRELQEEFERFRESRTPVEAQQYTGVCDERIGRICIWFGGEENETFPSEFREVGQARIDLIRALDDAMEQAPNEWLLGQQVHYLVENRNLDEAERVSVECGITETWWCSALHGYVLHVRTEYVESETAFREAVTAIPDDVYDRWTTPRYIFTSDGEDSFSALPPAERDATWEMFWKLSDPLFLFTGNDRLTDHFARLVVAHNREDASAPQGLEWDDDVAETLIRYGRNTGYSRSHDPGRTMSAFGGLNDTRRMIGHHHPKSRGYLFPEAFLESPSDIPPESWITAPREARTWYAPPYAPEIRGLETQVGRFRVEDEMLVIGAYRPTVTPLGSDEIVSAWRENGGIEGDPHAALFLVPVDGGRNVVVQGSEPEGVLTVQTQPDRYVSSIEVVDLEGRQAWRARQGVVQTPLPPGLPGVSDLMIMKPDAPEPQSLEEAIPWVRPGVRLAPGERFSVFWEVYGLRIREPIRITIGFSEGRPGFLSRIGEFLGIMEPDSPVDVTFEETGPDQVQALFRSVSLQLPDLEPGEYTLHLRLELAGRNPVITSRPIVVGG